MLAGLFVSWGWCATVGAQTQTSSATEEVLVEAPLELPQTVDPSATVHQVPAERLQQARRRGEDLARLVDEVAGVRVLDLGGPVSQKQLTLRGGAPTQALIIVDGVPLRTPFARGFDLGLVHPEILESVEVVRGGQGASWGDGALTGALLLQTRKAGRAPFAALSVMTGSFGTARLSAVALAPGLSLSGSYERTAGDFDYVSELVGLPDAPRVRGNNDSQRASASLAVNREVGEGTLDLRASVAAREGGVPGLADSPGESWVARERTRHLRAHGAWSRPLDWADGGQLRVMGYATQLDLDYEDPALDVRNEVAFHSAGGDADLTLGAFESHLFRLVVSAAGEWVRGPDFPARGRAAMALSDEWLLDRLSVFGALRAEFVGGQRLAVLPRLGLKWQATDELALGVALGRSLRTPTLDELYHPQEVAYAGNPDLESEQSWEAELQASLRHQGWFLQVAGFARRIERAILYLNRNAFVVRPENVGGARALGLEVEGRGQGQWGPVQASVSAQVSLLAAQLELTKARLPTQPQWTMAAEGRLRWARLALTSAVRAVGPTFVNLRPSAQQQVPTYVRWDAGLMSTLHPQVALGLEVVNLLDRQTLISVNRFPLPGRTVFMTLRLSAGERL